MNIAPLLPLDGAELRSIMANGTDFLGAEIIKQIFGEEVRDSEIFFSPEELRKLKQKHSLFTPAQIPVKKIHDKFENQTADKKKFLYELGWYENESLYASEIPVLGTRIITREPVEKSIGRNMLDCQYLLIEHAKNHLPIRSCSETFNKNLNLAEQELRDSDTEIRKWMKKDGPEVAEKIANLAVCKMFTPEFSAMAQFAFVDNRVNNNRKLFSSVYSWSKSLTSDRQYFPGFGGFDDFNDGGANVLRGLPRYDWSNQSVLFSCGVDILFI